MHSRERPVLLQTNSAAGSGPLWSNQIPSLSRAWIAVGSTHLDPIWWRSNTVMVANVRWQREQWQRVTPPQVFTHPRQLIGD